MKKEKTILVAPLNWGLGHATRCIPIIYALLEQGYEVIIASDGAALTLLQKEFPTLESKTLPSYNITYPKKGVFFKLKLLTHYPRIKKAVNAEKKMVNKWVQQNKIQAIISDNRWGVRHKNIPSVLITHQLQVLSGTTTYLSSKMHQKFIKKFNVCWVPDFEGFPNLSGKLGHPKKLNITTKYIGPLTRLKKLTLPKIYDVLCLLSGPEPQRTILEEKLKSVFINSNYNVLFVRGVMEVDNTPVKVKNLTLISYLTTPHLEKAINQSEVVVSRSGYTTIMDLAALDKKAYFIPTPGQFEQVYLAKQLKNKGIVPSCKQEHFSIEKLNEIPLYKGLSQINNDINFKELFSLFEGK